MKTRTLPPSQMPAILLPDAGSHFLRALLLIIALAMISSVSQAQPGAHDPSRMIRNTDGRYWIFTTGQGVYAMSSSNANFTDWRAEPTPFGNSWPSWISNYVTGFTGNFWAPDVVKIGSTYYLYYSCAGQGAPAAIGVATATNLAGPWTDKGMVVAGNNAIDPAILIDGSNMWMTWGNWQTGIDIVQLSMSTGKRLNSSMTHLVSGEVEGPALLKNGSYYYLFFQRGLCCSGVNSTYYVVVARSTSVTGPYTGERVFLPNRNGNIIGPGHIGYGEGKLTYHYYDGNSNGTARLFINTLGWGSDGWPIAGGTPPSSGQTIANGTYKIRNRASGKYLDNMGRTADGDDVAQWASSSSTNQRWVVTYENGYYRIRGVSNNKFLDNVGRTADGSTVGQWASSPSYNQHWTISATGSYYKITNRSNGKCIDTGGSTTDGSAMQFWYSNTSNNQQWTFELVSTSTARMASTETELEETMSDEDSPLTIYSHPNPATTEITIDLPKSYNGEKLVNLIDPSGKVAVSEKFNGTQHTINIQSLPAGLYILKVSSNKKLITEKIIKR